jgi:hypothetical protein
VTPTGPGLAVIERLSRLRGNAIGIVERVQERKSLTAPLEPVDSARVAITSLLEVSGWIYGNDDKPGTGMFVIVDGTRRIDLPQAYGVERDDVARAYSNPSLAYVGYVFNLPAGTFKPGRHALQVALVSAGRAGFYTLPKPLVLDFVRR